MSADGSARGATGTATTPYALSESSQGSVTEMNQVADEGFSYELNSWLSADATYKYSRSTLDANANYLQRVQRDYGLRHYDGPPGRQERTCSTTT